MRSSSAMILGAALLVGCAKQSDLDAANAKLAAANATIETADAKLARASSIIDDLSTQLASLRTVNEQLSARLAVKPPLPLTWASRKSILGAGMVVTINTTLMEPLDVLATVCKTRVELNLVPSAPSYLGGAMGVALDAGDEITLTNSSYTPLTFTVQ